MMTNRPCDEVSEVAALYALGKLPDAEARGFERRLESGCSLCQTELESHQRTAELLLSATVGVAPPASLEQRLLQSLMPQAAPGNGAEVLRSHDGEWIASPDPGVSYRFLHGRKTVLVRMQPGSYCSSHDHAFDENCLVLEGTVEDADMKLSAGDFLFMPAGSSHTPSYTETGCLLLISYT
jgi:mannose-6-phosphate isomerase-like protein (cupin superfamily)